VIAVDVRVHKESDRRRRQCLQRRDDAVSDRRGLRVHKEDSIRPDKRGGSPALAIYAINLTAQQCRRDLGRGCRSTSALRDCGNRRRERCCKYECKNFHFLPFDAYGWLRLPLESKICHGTIAP
jgi:hypothetical protein